MNYSDYKHTSPVFLCSLLPLALVVGCSAAPKTSDSASSQSAVVVNASQWIAKPLHKDCVDCTTPTPKTLAQPRYFIAEASPPVALPLTPAPRLLVDLPKVAQTVVSPDHAVNSKAVSAKVNHPKTTFHYATASARPLNLEARKIRAFKEELLVNPQAVLLITGHADSTGSLATNERMSVRRAVYLQQALIRQGVAPKRIKVRVAPLEYADSNSHRHQRAMNRRATVEIIEATT
jgi:outer membrane protein OmpA-like peptidoglycan-associated protein